MSPDKIFITTLNELAAIASDPDIERMKDACRIMRMLFLDGAKSVVDQANRAVGMKLTFKITSIESNQHDWFAHDDIDPHHRFSPQDTKIVKRDPFFATSVLRLGGTPITVRELILCGANVLGGVHGGMPDDKEKKIVAAEIASPGSLSAAVRPLVRIVLRALAPLRDHLQDLKRFDRAPGFGLVIQIQVQALDPEGDLQICSWGSDPRARFFVDRDAVLRTIVYEGSSKTPLAGAHVPIRRPFWLMFFAVSDGGDELLFRWVVDDVEQVRLVALADHPEWMRLISLSAGSLGYSEFGTWASGDVVLFNKMPNDYESLRALCVEQLRTFEEASAPVWLFPPGAGMELQPPVQAGVDPKPATLIGKGNARPRWGLLGSLLNEHAHPPVHPSSK